MNVDALRPMPRADRVDRDTLADISDFLFYEAQLLDAHMFDEWFKLVDPGIRYLMPTRVTRVNGEGSEISDSSHIDDAYQALRSRVARLMHRLNWAENPASRTRHFVTNVRAFAWDCDGRDGFRVTSNLLFHRSRADEARSDYLSCMRQDTLVVAAGEYRLLERIVILDHTTLPTHNVSFLL